MPWRYVSEAGTDHLVFIIDHDDMPLRHFDVGGLLEYLDDITLVIITSVDEATDTGSVKPLLSNITPALHTFHH